MEGERIEEDVLVCARAVSGRFYKKLPSDTRAIAHLMAWEMLLKPRMMKHWENMHAGFDPCSGCYPEPLSGKNYSMTLKDSAVPGMPRVYSDNYLAQAVLCYFVDPDMTLIHFGKQTHWKLKLLIDPLWAITSLLSPSEGMVLEPEGMYAFEGDEQAWHITALPNKQGKEGKPIRRNSHFDAGPGNLFHEGIPPAMPIVQPASSPSLSRRERAMLKIALHQLAVIFYCETPWAADYRKRCDRILP